MTDNSIASIKLGFVVAAKNTVLKSIEISYLARNNFTSQYSLI
jgi:hypothetical protein